MRIFCPMDQVTNFLKKKNVESEKNVFFVFNINNFGFTFSIYIDALIVCLLLVYAFFLYVVICFLLLLFKLLKNRYLWGIFSNFCCSVSKFI